MSSDAHLSDVKVSILMTTFNVAPYVDQAIQSILNQTHTNWELLVADDCSTDETYDVLKSYQDPRIKVSRNKQNLHYLRTRNQLVDQVEGEYITLLDSDDWCTPNRLQRQLQEFTDNPDLGMCGSLVQFVNQDGSPLHKTDSKPLTYNEIKSNINQRSTFTGSTIMVKTEVWKELGGYRDFFNGIGYEDYDFTSRLVERYQAINIPEALYVYRQYPESTSKRDVSYNPFKLHGEELVKHFIQQREQQGEDSLSAGDIPAIIGFIVNCNRPFVDDPSRIYRQYMWSYLDRSMNGLAFNSILKALSIKPLTWVNWRTLGLLILIRMGLLKNA